MVQLVLLEVPPSDPYWGGLWSPILTLLVGGLVGEGAILKPWKSWDLPLCPSLLAVWIP